MILAGLAGLVARRFLRMPHLTPFTLLLWGRLNRAVRRFARGLTRPAMVRAPRQRTTSTDTGRAAVPGLPSRRGWLVAELGYEAAGFGAQLQHLLDEPAMQAILIERPGLGRIMRPICRMLGVSAPIAPRPLVVAASVVTARPAGAVRPVPMRDDEGPMGSARDCAAGPS